MGGNYGKSVYNQLVDVMARLDVMEAEHKSDRKEIASLNAEVKSLQKENSRLKTELDTVKAENTALREENDSLRKENQLLRDDNERMKRTLNNNSTNSSQPPSSDPPGKAPNTYNSRKPTKKKAGAQPGHKGAHISKAEVEKKIQEGRMEHRVEEIGTPGNRYVTRYRLDLEVHTVATEIRIYADENGKFEIPKEYRADVSYGENIKVIAAFLYSEGVGSNDRICLFLNSLSQDTLGISTGSIYRFCRSFLQDCSKFRPILEENLLNSEVVCTDATTITTNGKQTYIRNLSTSECVLYYGCKKKDLDALGKLRVLKEYAGTLIHDHETSMYHFGTHHGECDVHLGRYLQKNTEETGHPWSHHMDQFLKHARNERIRSGDTAFTDEQLARYESRYEELIGEGREANQTTKGLKAKKEENALLNRLEKYKANHLLFLHDFKVPFSNNMSEKDLRICKNREKIAGGFRNGDGRQMYCDIISFVETVKRKKKNILRVSKPL